MMTSNQDINPHGTAIEMTILKTGKPSLFSVAPLTASICWIFAAINLVVGCSLFLIYKPTVPILVINTVMTYKVWGVIFAIVGLLGIYALLKNRWNHIRRLLLVGLAIKATWMIALVIRCIQSPQGTILFTSIWLFFATVQAVTYIFFLPEITTGKDNEQQ